MESIDTRVVYLDPADVTAMKDFAEAFERLGVKGDLKRYEDEGFRVVRFIDMLMRGSLRITIEPVRSHAC